MMVVDSSVWIDYFNGQPTPQTRYLRDRAERSQIVVGDLILCEVLQGFRRDRDVRTARELLLGFQYRELVGQQVALEAAGHYRTLRTKGVTARKTIDMLIATFCLRNNFALLHADRDFDPIEAHLGLQVIRT
ncbi:type II toxin-antitoxin system VapC family toxin [Imhoffiella purpurea]|uniref:Ribonuclease VapC n=1 Tax=Imhoffiella purpurea TaxID=1249627 RepID=W9V9S3_9GAMM|nr:PIN domain nuclease [Imhoffiella purpurea]EXJ16323.1 PIN domain protein [Imhoffiella purpurea]